MQNGLPLIQTKKKEPKRKKREKKKKKKKEKKYSPLRDLNFCPSDLKTCMLPLSYQVKLKKKIYESKYEFIMAAKM